MDIEKLRKKFLAEIAAAAESAKPAELKAVRSYAASEGIDTKKLCEMIQALSLDEGGYAGSVRLALDLLADESLAPEVRVAALSHLGAAEFQPAGFAPFHAEFIELLRSLSLSPEPAVRLAALERLTLTNDAEAHRLLRESLEQAREPLVAPAKAIQLLARDEHGASVPLFRKLASTSSGQIREQALRALSADTQSVPLFEAIALDKAEEPALRQIAAMNLKNTSATRFAALASAIAFDPQESDDLRAVAISAIVHTSEVAAKLNAPALAETMRAIGASTQSRALKASVERFSKAFGGKP